MRDLHTYTLVSDLFSINTKNTIPLSGGAGNRLILQINISVSFMDFHLNQCKYQ